MSLAAATFSRAIPTIATTESSNHCLCRTQAVHTGGQHLAGMLVHRPPASPIRHSTTMSPRAKPSVWALGTCSATQRLSCGRAFAECGYQFAVPSVLSRRSLLTYVCICKCTLGAAVTGRNLWMSRRVHKASLRGAVD